MKRTIAAALCLLVVACGGDDEQADGTPADTTAGAVAARPTALSDAEALGVLSALSEAAAEAARAPLDLVENSEVRRYFNVVRADHTALNAELSAIADSLQLTPAPHAAANRARTAAQDVTTAAGQLTAGAADAPLLQQQQQLQSTLLAVLDSTVLPGTRQELLRQYANAVRPMVAAHLQRVSQLEELLKEEARRRAAAPAPRPVTPRPARVDTVAPPPPPPDTGLVSSSRARVEAR